MAVKVATERKPGSQVVLSVEVPEDQVTTSIERAYQRLAPRVKIAGFRPGKAPRPMVERQIGWPALRQEAIDQLLPTAYNAALDETGLDPIDVPRVEVDQFDPGQPMRFRATVSIKPEVTLKDYRDIRVPRPRTEVTDQEVADTLERLRGRFAELHDVERPVQPGDFLRVDLHLLQNGAVLVGKSQTDAQVEVDPERLLSGLSEGLEGQTVGETRDIRLTLPQDYPERDLAGQQTTFRVTVKSIKERRLPPLDDDLARQVGDAQTLDELRQSVREDLQEAAARSDEARFENDVLKALNERIEVELPEALVDREVNREIRELELRLQEQGVRFDRYLEYTKTTPDVLRAERRPQAAQKVRLELALEAVADREGLTVSEEEIDEAVSKALSEDAGLSRRAEDLRTADPVREYFRHQLLIRKTIDHLSSLASSESSDTMSPQSTAGESATPAATAGKAGRKASRTKEG
ncbi:MAG TPA: trigger factor [Candidatus Limnocylindrales bacterium]|nr:trigger factor [Candidatus Limnocylindrales bacterium]